MTQINLLPWRDRQRQLKQAMVGALMGAFLLLAILIIIGIHMNMSALTSIQMRRNDFLQTEITNAQSDFTSLKEKKEEQIKLLSSLKFILNLRVKSYLAVNILDILAQATPSTIILEKVSRENHTVTVTGVAQTDNDVTLLMKKMAGHANFTDPALTEISSMDTPGGMMRHFTLKIDEKG